MVMWTTWRSSLKATCSLHHKRMEAHEIYLAKDDTLLYSNGDK